MKDECRPGSRAVRWSLLVAGTLSLGLGGIGIFVPLLPTTPFLLLSAACYTRGSQRFYCWLMNNRLFGAYLLSYREGRGLPIRARAFTVALLWLTIGLSGLLFVEGFWMRALLFTVAALVTVHVALLRPKRRPLSGRE